MNKHTISITDHEISIGIREDKIARLEEDNKLLRETLIRRDARIQQLTEWFYMIKKSMESVRL